MDVKKAAAETMKYATKGPPLDKASAHHLAYMNRRIQAGEVTGEKAHRWLGWMQACVYIAGGASHETLKLINKNA